MALYSTTFTAAGQVTGAILVEKDEPYEWEVGLGYSGGIGVEYSPDAGKNVGWQVVVATATTVLLQRRAEATGYYRLLSGISGGASLVTIRNLPSVLERIQGERGVDVWRVESDGVALRAKSVIGSAGAPTPSVSRSFGASLAEGLGLLMLDEIVDLTAAAALFVDLTSLLPDTAQVWAINAQIVELVVAGGLSVKVGIGPSGDPDKYGLTGDLLLDSQTNSGVLVGGTPLAADEQVRVNAATAAGAAGDTDFSAGKVRVRALYALERDLTDVFADI